MQDLLELLKPGSPEHRLACALDPARLPAHVGIIMDGNGRWARRRSLPRVAGHKAGVEPVRMVVETCARLGIQSLTLYAFSMENWKRPPAEVEALWRLLTFYLGREVAHLKANNIRLRSIGRVHELDPAVRRELETAVAATAACTGLTLNLAINYGGRGEIVDAVNRLIEDARQQGRLDGLRVDEAAIAGQLDTAGQPELDLLIRTSGELRISNFLLWQVAYAELYITDICWPDFQRATLLEALAAYQRRDRRFGGLRSPTAPAAGAAPRLEAAGPPLP
jgi:undecaprenyl diphosphate synthase